MEPADKIENQFGAKLAVLGIRLDCECVVACAFVRATAPEEKLAIRSTTKPVRNSVNKKWKSVRVQWRSDSDK
jgi:hypothetical protein